MFAGTASAGTAANVAYNGVCGAGYTVIDFADVEASGTLYLTWNDATGKHLGAEHGT